MENSSPSPSDRIALTIRKPWIDFILEGKKKWEIRGTSTKIRGEVLLIESGSGCIVGKAMLVDCLGPFTLEEFVRRSNLHLTPEQELRSGLPYRRTFAWIFERPERLPRPQRYRHPSGAITWVRLRNFVPGQEDFTTTLSLGKVEFMRSLAEDLAVLGHQMAFEQTGDELQVRVTYNETPRDDACVREIFRSLSKQVPEAISVTKAEGDSADGGSPPPASAVRPVLEICSSASEEELFHSIRRRQNLPTSEGTGRRIHAVLWDEGPSPRTAMGIIGLSSPNYAVKCRDDLFLWPHEQGGSAKPFRERGLRHMMHLTICMALPPYNKLRVGRLLALLPFSRPIVTAFRARYGDELLAITTTSAFGTHGSVFRRLHPDRVPGASAAFRSNLYDRIGETSGEALFIVSERTKLLAHSFLRGVDEQAWIQAKRFGDEGVLKKAMHLSSLPRDLLRFVRMGIFIGYLSRNCLAILRGEEMSLHSFSHEFDDCISYWRADIIRATQISPTSRTETV